MRDLLRRVVRVRLVLPFFAGCFTHAAAQRPELNEHVTLAHMNHTVWTARDGAPQGIKALAEAPDGTLWIGALGGLFRFDGRAFDAFQALPGEAQLPGEAIYSLRVARDGALWVGFFQSGAARITDGHVTLHPKTDNQRLGVIQDLHEAKDGSIWAISQQVFLVRFGADGKWHLESTPLGRSSFVRLGGLFIDSADNLWISQGGRLYRRQLPDSVYSPTDVPSDLVSKFAEASDGSIWMTDVIAKVDRGRTQRFDRSGHLLATLPDSDMANAIVIAPDGSLIRATQTSGLRRHLVGGTAITASEPGALRRSDSYTHLDGLTSDEVEALVRDADGSVWVGGRRGLDRLRIARFTPFITEDPNGRWAVCANDRGEVWISSSTNQLYRVSNGTTTPISNAGISRLSCGRDGATRVVDGTGIWNVRANHLERASNIPGLPPYGVMQVVSTTDGNLFATVGGGAPWGGVWQFAHGRWARHSATGLLDRAGFVEYVDSKNRLWMGYVDGAIGLPLENAGRLFHSGQPGIGVVYAILETSHGLFATGTNGVAVLRDTSFQMLAFADQTLARAVSGLVESRNGDLWLNAARGITHVDAAELQTALRDPRHLIQSELLTEGEFVGPGPPWGPLATAARDASGNLWFAMLNGVFYLDPERSTAPRRPPIVSIKSITADGITPDTRRQFRPKPQTVEIQYFGVQLTAPERVIYRHRLDGLDDEWQGAGGRTEAIYTRLGPGSYTFRVMASNGDGRWTTPVSSMAFTVLPSFYRTTWFALLCVLSAFAVLWAAFTLRVRAVSRTIKARAEERADERIRIARELHDTLLGDMAGVAMQLSAGARRAEASGEGSRGIVDLLSTMSAQVQRSLVEARRSVTAMRASPEQLTPLHEQLAKAAQEAFADTRIAARVEQLGAATRYPPSVEAEIVGIVTEAMTNARKHADSRTVTITLTYQPRQLDVRVRDDGRGFDASLATPTGHWGLVGMRERATMLHAQLSVTSTLDGGTEVTLVVPRENARGSRWTRLIPFKQR